MQSSSKPAFHSIIMPLLTAIVAVAIFVVDTVTPLDIAVAVLYVAVVDRAKGPAARKPSALPIRGFVQATGRRLWDLAPDGSRFLIMFP